MADAWYAVCACLTATTPSGGRLGDDDAEALNIALWEPLSAGEAAGGWESTAVLISSHDTRHEVDVSVAVPVDGAYGDQWLAAFEIGWPAIQAAIDSLDRARFDVVPRTLTIERVSR